MPSLRKRVSTYLRQLSFHNEPRSSSNHRNLNENSFVTKYLQGQIKLREGPPIIYGKTPTELPNYELDQYQIGSNTIIGCYSGPKGGLTTVKRVEKHLSIPDQDIDFIDTGTIPDDNEGSSTTKNDNNPQPNVLSKRTQNNNGGGVLSSVDNTTMVIKVGGQEYCVTNRIKKQQKSHSLGSLNDVNDDVIIEKTVRIDNGDNDDKQLKDNLIDGDDDDDDNDGNRVESIDDNLVSDKATNYGLTKSKSEGNPFRHGKIIKMTTRPMRDNNGDNTAMNQITIDDSLLPNDWLKKSDFVYGISDSLYDRNQVTNNRNGDPIADCFGIIARDDSAILAVADGVNWGEKASIAAKSAIHGCLHYLNKTIFNDTKPFDKLTVKHDDLNIVNNIDDDDDNNANDDDDNTVQYNDTTFQRIANTKEIFVCLLRAFNCAHDLILENNGMLTTLTVAIVLPLKRKIKQPQQQDNTTTFQNNKQYICCVCNVGDTLAYVYSKKFGIRELTKGSHDINCLRDMRDALGALGPVDGINPELSNLTLSITTLQHGDIIMVASDGLTDNFDPNVCRFTVNQPIKNDNKENQNSRRDSGKQRATTTTTTTRQQQPTSRKPPVKPPRRTPPQSQPQPQQPKTTTTKTTQKDKDTNPLIEHFLKQNPIDNKPNPSNYRRQISSQSCTESSSSGNHLRNKTTPPPQGYKFLRSKTTIDVKTNQRQTLPIQRNDDGIPFVTPIHRYELQLLLMEDIIMNGLNGNEQSRCKTAKQLCENLINFTYSITSAKRHTLEDNDLYYNNCNGLLVEITQQEKRQRRKKCLEKVQNLPGKLDHVSIVAWNVGNTVN